MSCIRLSIINLYTHLFSGSRSFILACRIMTVVCGSWALAEILVIFLICRPLAYNWDPTLDGGCGDSKTAYLSIHISNFIIDSLIAILPARTLWKLQMRTARKIQIIALFALGALYVQSLLLILPVSVTFFSFPYPHCTACFVVLRPLLPGHFSPLLRRENGRASRQMVC